MVLVAEVAGGAVGSRPKLVPEGLQARKIRSDATFVAAAAKERNWNLSADSLESYWRVEGQTADPRLGEFLVARLLNPEQPGGAQEQELWFVHGGARARWIFGPLITQLPPTSAYQQQIAAGKVSVISAGADQLVWVELQDKLSEPLEGGAKVKTTQWTYAYAFRVSGENKLSCVAFRIPVNLRVAVDAEVQRESTLKVTFPARGMLSVERSTSTVDAEQEKWIGKQPLDG
jgi:hypothetical protein